MCLCLFLVQVTENTTWILTLLLTYKLYKNAYFLISHYNYVNISLFQNGDVQENLMHKTIKHSYTLLLISHNVAFPYAYKNSTLG